MLLFPNVHIGLYWYIYTYHVVRNLRTFSHSRSILMSSFDYSTGTETDEELETEWSENLENVQFQMRWDEESHHLTDLMRELNVGYCPTSGFADGFVFKRWDFPRLSIREVLSSHVPGRPPLRLTDERINDFIKVATAYAYHYRPYWVSRKYVHAIAAEMIRHHYGVQVL